ncbi:SRPBCC family protein [Mycobacterium neglectum]|uniref:SRPBCC family protein n=1 Tax=Mycobacterium neglectum TaxID=242737 RepID=UPI000BFF0F7D|nr:SRPBCC family protein [Mycobacterium neglectum]
MVTSGLRLAGAMAILYAARRFYRNWGTTKQECGMYLVGDETGYGPGVQSTEAVSIDAPAGTVWPWLVQMGQDRGGLYTYEKFENLVGLRYVNADRVHPEWQHLAPGDTVRFVPLGWMGLRDGIVFEVVEVADQQSIVLRAFTGRKWNVVWSFHLVPRGRDRCRLLIRVRTKLRQPGQALVTELVEPARALMTRGMLLGIKRRAQQQFQAEASAARASEDLHRVV